MGRVDPEGIEPGVCSEFRTRQTSRPQELALRPSVRYGSRCWTGIGDDEDLVADCLRHQPDRDG